MPLENLGYPLTPAIRFAPVSSGAGGDLITAAVRASGKRLSYGTYVIEVLPVPPAISGTLTISGTMIQVSHPERGSIRQYHSLKVSLATDLVPGLTLTLKATPEVGDVAVVSIGGSVETFFDSNFKGISVPQTKLALLGAGTLTTNGTSAAVFTPPYTRIQSLWDIYSVSGAGVGDMEWYAGPSDSTSLAQYATTSGNLVNTLSTAPAVRIGRAPIEVGCPWMAQFLNKGTFTNIVGAFYAWLTAGGTGRLGGS